MPFDTFIGGAAAFCTTVSYIPHSRKRGRRGETGDLSLTMLLLLGSGLALWIVYGVIRGDFVIIAANAVSLALLSCTTFFKLRGRKGGQDEGTRRPA